MQRNNIVALRQALQAAFEKREVRLTGTAAELIYGMVDAVVRDPHPSWPLRTDGTGSGETELDKFQREMIDKLAGHLRDIPGGKTNTVTTFDILHRVSPIIDKICPFEKG